MTTKHDRIIRYIMNLEPGSAISVRRIARELGVSQGQHTVQSKSRKAEYVKTFPRMHHTD